ncbi:MAG: SDR family NAD(P)-dependent oxidoreductase [Myxococcota bacterium]
MPDSRPTTLITGSTDGIGKETARQLLVHGHRVILHGRSAQRVDAVKADLAAPGRQIHSLVGDLSSLETVRAMAAEALDRFERIDVLVNNAGIYMNEAKLTVDGFEQTFAVNHLAPFLLTHLLMPVLGERIINVSSMAHARGRLDRTTWRSLRGFDPYGAYAQSKLANVLFTVDLARRLEPGLSTFALHPGVISTKLLTEGFGMRGPDSLAAGADTSVWLATDANVTKSPSKSGQYFAKRQEARMHPLASDPRAAADFFNESARLVGVTPLPTR